jgi:hypothetical protein
MSSLVKIRRLVANGVQATLPGPPGAAKNAFDLAVQLRKAAFAYGNEYGSGADWRKKVYYSANNTEAAASIIVHHLPGEMG